MPLYKVYEEDYFGNARDVLPKGLQSFFFLRHGVTDANEEGLAQGHKDNSLNEKGVEQARAARAIIKGLGIERVYCSPLKRARQTAKICTEGLNLPIHTEHMLKERSFGKYEGQKPPSRDMYFGNYDTCENTEQFARKQARGLHPACLPWTLIVGHGCSGRTIMGMLELKPADDTFFDNAQVLYFQRTSTGWLLHNLSAQRIASITALELLDAKGRPVVEAKVTTASGVTGEAAAATGSTVGGHEPYLLKDNDISRYNGAGVLKACENVETVIADALSGMSVFDQEGIDSKMRELDGTDDFSNLGGNSIGSVSFAVINAAANAMNIPLYEFVNKRPVDKVHRPIFNVINGKRSGDRQDIFYEYIVVPHGAKTIDEAIRMGVETRQALPKAWKVVVGEKPVEGAAFGYQAHSSNPAEVLTLMAEAIKIAGHEGKMCFAVDCAAVDVYDEETKTYPWMGERVSAEQLIGHIKPLTEKFPLLFIEDLLHEDDFDGHASARKQLTRTNIIGDDLTVSNRARLETCVKAGAIDGFILKLNQSGTVTDALKALQYAADKKLFVVSSLRSGGTLNDPTTDFSIGFEAVLLQKTGSPASADRTNPLNKMMRFAKANPNAKLVDFGSIIRF